MKGDRMFLDDGCPTHTGCHVIGDHGGRTLVQRKVVRLHRNITDEWVKLTWAEGGEQKELIATPGHHFLDRFGSFPTIEEMLENGRATVVLASGALTEVTAERITYSAQTAHLFEQAQAVGEKTWDWPHEEAVNRPDAGADHPSNVANDSNCARVSRTICSALFDLPAGACRASKDASLFWRAL